MGGKENHELSSVSGPRTADAIPDGGVESAREAYISLPGELAPDNLGFHLTESIASRSIRPSSYHASTTASRGSYRRYYCSRATFARLHLGSRFSSSGLRRAVRLERYPPLSGELLIERHGRTSLRHRYYRSIDSGRADPQESESTLSACPSTLEVFSPTYCQSSKRAFTRRSTE